MKSNGNEDLNQGFSRNPCLPNFLHDMKLVPSSLKGKLLLLFSVVQAFVVITLEGLLMSDSLIWENITNTQDANRGLPVYMVIFVVSQIWSIFLSWNAILQRNTMQLVTFVLFNVSTFAYSLFQYNQLKTHDSSFIPVIIILPCILGLFTFAFSYFTYKLYQEFGWIMYKTMGADISIKNMFQYYQWFLTLLKIDVFFWLAFSIQYLVLVLLNNDAEYYITIGSLPITAILLVIAVYGLKKESKNIMRIFLIGQLVGTAYFVYKITRFWTTKNKQLQGSINYLTFFAGISLFMLLATMIVTVICYRNFDRGLRRHLE